MRGYLESVLTEYAEDRGYGHGLVVLAAVWEPSSCGHDRQLLHPKIRFGATPA
jgi:hypothetical protein